MVPMACVRKKTRIKMSKEKTPLTFHSTGCLIGILIP